MALKRILVVPDCHVPYHDKRAWKLFLKAAAGFKPHTLVIMGDFADFYGVSDHNKDPNRARNLEWEVGEVNKALDQLDAIGAKEKKFVAGNHCDRLTRYLQVKAPELFNVVKIPELFKLKERGWTYTPYKDDTRVGKVYFTHDTGKAGVGAVRSAAQDYQHNVVIGHLHRINYLVEGNARGEPHLAACFGWLGDVKQVDYMHRVKAARDWALGFGEGYMDTESGIVYLKPVTIVNYTAVVGEKLYKV